MFFCTVFPCCYHWDYLNYLLLSINGLSVSSPCTSIYPQLFRNCSYTCATFLNVNRSRSLARTSWRSLSSEVPNSIASSYALSIVYSWAPNENKISSTPPRLLNFQEFSSTPSPLRPRRLFQPTSPCIRHSRVWAGLELALDCQIFRFFRKGWEGLLPCLACMRLYITIVRLKCLFNFVLILLTALSKVSPLFAVETVASWVNFYRSLLLQRGISLSCWHLLVDLFVLTKPQTFLDVYLGRIPNGLEYQQLLKLDDTFFHSWWCTDSSFLTWLSTCRQCNIPKSGVNAELKLSCLVIYYTKPALTNNKKQKVSYYIRHIVKMLFHKLLIFRYSLTWLSSNLAIYVNADSYFSKIIFCLSFFQNLN